MVIPKYVLCSYLWNESVIFSQLSSKHSDRLTNKPEKLNKSIYPWRYQLFTFLRLILPYWKVLPDEKSNICLECLSQIYFLLLLRILQADLKPFNQQLRHHNNPKPHLWNNTNLQHPERDCHYDRRKTYKDNAWEISLPSLYAAYQWRFRRWSPPWCLKAALSYMIILYRLIIIIKNNVSL